MSSGGSTLGPLDKKLSDRIKRDAAAVIAKDRRGRPIPAADAVTTSGSGLDPDISPENAYLQSTRVAAHRGLAVQAVDAVIAANTQGPTLGFIGQSRVNVLAVNRALDERYSGGPP